MEDPRSPQPPERGERPARPGEKCGCGRQAVTVYITNKGHEAPYCGIPDGGANRPQVPEGMTIDDDGVKLSEMCLFGQDAQCRFGDDGCSCSCHNDHLYAGVTLNDPLARGETQHPGHPETRPTNPGNPGDDCPIAWCDGNHDVTDTFIHHRAQVGTASVQGLPITVTIKWAQSTTGGPDLSPFVQLCWPTAPPPDGVNAHLPVEGLDMSGREARELSRLLLAACVRLAGAL